MAVMVFVDMVGGAWPGIGHHPWNGIHLADFVMPSFLFLVGISAAIVLRNLDGQRLSFFKKVVWRALKLFFVGILIQGRWFWTIDLATFRIMGILQRIAIAYAAAAVIKIIVPEQSPEVSWDIANGGGCIDLWLFKRYMAQWSAVFVTLCAYLVMVQAVSVPRSGCHAGDWMVESGKVSCASNMRCNVASWIDSSILGAQHLYIPKPGFDPEGLATTLGCIFTVYMGIHMGHTHLALKEETPWRCWRHWLLVSSSLLLVGLALWPLVPVNKRMWSISYNFVTTGSAALLLTALRAFELLSAGSATVAPSAASRGLLVAHNAEQPSPAQVAQDRAVSRRVANLAVKALEPMRMLGTNALLFFVLSDSGGITTLLVDSVYWKKPENNVVAWFMNTVLFGWLGCQCQGWTAANVLGTTSGPPNQCTMILVYSLMEIAVWCVICWVLYRKNWFWKL